MKQFDLPALGWSDRWRDLFAPHDLAGLLPARVLLGSRGGAVVAAASGTHRAQPATALVKSANEQGLPVVGDWVALLDAPDLDVPHMVAVLPRAGEIARGAPGDGGGRQLLAANVDLVLVTHPIAAEPNLRRIERELALAWESGATPVVVLTKADLSAAPADALEAVRSVAFGVDVFMTSAATGDGVDDLLGLLSRGLTAVLIGPSGAGKSTLVNAFLGEERQATREVRATDGRGRHTTVVRELISLPSGGMIIDTPGLRALALTGSEAGIEAAFPDIEAAAGECRFRDCAHAGEPGCAVAAAVASGALPAERLQSYHKLLREAQVAAARTDARLRAAEERKSKSLSKAVREYYRITGRR